MIDKEKIIETGQIVTSWAKLGVFAAAATSIYVSVVIGEKLDNLYQKWRNPKQKKKSN